MSVSPDTFYRVKEAKESGGPEALLHKDRRLEGRIGFVVFEAGCISLRG